MAGDDGVEHLGLGGQVGRSAEHERAVGGMAAHLNDLPVPATVDIDVTPSRRPANLERLAKAFDELEAASTRRRSPEPGSHALQSRTGLSTTTST